MVIKSLKNVKKKSKRTMIEVAYLNNKVVSEQNALKFSLLLSKETTETTER